MPFAPVALVALATLAALGCVGPITPINDQTPIKDQTIAPTFLETMEELTLSYQVDREIGTLLLPPATAGTGTLTYSLGPDIPGLSFNAGTRTLRDGARINADFLMFKTEDRWCSYAAVGCREAERWKRTRRVTLTPRGYSWSTN